MAVYKSGIPLATDRLSSSQNDLLNNFTAIKALVDVNHETFANGVSPEGKHKFVTMPEQGAAPATLANEGALYTKVGATSAVAELFFRRESSGDEIGFTEGTLANNGWTRLPCGLLVKWGKVGTPVNFALNGAPGPNFDNAVLPFAVFCSSTDVAYPSSALLGGTAPAPTLYLNNVGGAQTYWLVIGV